MSLFITIVLDGVGVGAQPDAGSYGDVGSHTLAHVCETARPHLPHLTQLGLGCLTPLTSVPAAKAPTAAYGRLQEVSAGKDSTTGHWELAGLRLVHPFPTYSAGFPPDLIETFLTRTGCTGILGNKAASGTVIIDELGALQQQTGRPIVYTSADSVFQIAAHKDTLPLETLYHFCRIARDEVCVGQHAVGRVIARPFVGSPGAYRRMSAERKDFALPPPGLTVQEALQAHGVRTVSIGKIADLFDGVGFHETYKTKSNDQGVAETLRQIRTQTGAPTFIWVNLVDFDQEYGHRNDPEGFARALEAFDRALPSLLQALPSDGRLLITADHGNDPTMPGTDHSREYVPLLYYGNRPGIDLGLRTSFNDHAATVSAFFGIRFPTQGSSFEQP